MSEHVDAQAATHLGQALQRCSLKDCAMEILSRMLDELDVDALQAVERTAKRFKGMAIGSREPTAAGDVKCQLSRQDLQHDRSGNSLHIQLAALGTRPGAPAACVQQTLFSDE